MILERSSGKEYSRSYVSELQENVNNLERLLGSDVQGMQANVPDTTTHSGYTAQARRYVGDESGNTFMRRVMVAMDQACDSSLQEERVREQPPEARISYVSPHQWPSPEESHLLCSAYLEHFHPFHPILSRSGIWAMHEMLISGGKLHQKHYGSPDEQVKLRMVYALGAVWAYRQGRYTHHPFGHFTAALQVLIISGFQFASPKDVQNFLLIARFGMYYYIGCSIWELGQMCLRIAIELGLHQEAVMDSPSALEEQSRRLVFWDCYHLDRTSSSILGRPPGIADAEINIPLPLYTNEGNLCDQPNIDLVTKVGPHSELCVFIHTLLLTRIESAMQATMSSTGTPVSCAKEMQSDVNPCSPWSDTTFSTIETHCSGLQNWRERRPTSVYSNLSEENELYLKFLYRRVKLRLIRAVLDRDSNRVAHSSELLRGCLRTSLSLLDIFASLRVRGLVTYTRGFMHLVFSTGMTLAYACVQLVAKQRAGGPAIGEDDTNEWWLELFRELPVIAKPTDTLDGLNTASKLLWWMSEHIPDTTQYAQGFDRLKNKFERFLDGISEAIKVECFAGRRPLQPDSGLQSLPTRSCSMPPTASNGLRTEWQTGDINDTAPYTCGNLEQRPQLLPHWDTSLWPQDDAEIWSYLQVSPMNQFAYDLVDYAWEAPVLWPDGDMSLN